MIRYYGFRYLAPTERTNQWTDDKLVAVYSTLEAAKAVKRLFPESLWWRGREQVSPVNLELLS